MKYFLAIDVPQNLAIELYTFMSNVSDDSKEILSPDNLHMTVQYLGETTPIEVIKQLQLLSIKPFTLEIDKVDTFAMTDTSPGVVWVGPSKVPNGLLKLKSTIAERLAGFSIPLEAFPFVPHISLAFYTKTQGPMTAISPCSFHIDHVSLYSISDSMHFKKVMELPFATAEGYRTFSLLCVNDLHAALFKESGSPGISSLATAIKMYKKEHPHTHVFLGGDNYFGNPVSEALLGKPVSAFMKEIGTVASAIGNHDIDFGIKQLDTWQQQGDYRFLAANIKKINTDELPSCINPFIIIEEYGLRIAILGLSTQEYWTCPDRSNEWDAYQVENPATCTEQWMQAFERMEASVRPHAVIALTHLGLQNNKSGTLVGTEALELCAKNPLLKGVFTAHYHQFLQLYINDIPIVQGGSTARGFATLEAMITPSKELFFLPGYIDILNSERQYLEDDKVKEYIETALAETLMTEEIVAILDHPMPHRDPITNSIPLTGTPLSSFIGKAMTNYTHCDISLFYSGRIGSGFPTGPINAYEYYRTMMFENPIVKMQLTGIEIWNLIEVGLRTLSQEGASPLAWSGLEVEFDSGKPYLKRVISITTTNGSPIIMTKSYSVVMDEFTSCEQMGFQIPIHVHKEYLDKTMRQIVLDALRHQCASVLVQTTNTQEILHESTI